MNKSSRLSSYRALPPLAAYFLLTDKAVLLILECMSYLPPRDIHLLQSGAPFENCLFRTFCVWVKRAKIMTLSESFTLNLRLELKKMFSDRGRNFKRSKNVKIGSVLSWTKLSKNV